MKKKIIKLNHEIKRLQQLVLKYKRQLKKFRAIIDYDFLTGIHNRAGFLRETEKFFTAIKKSNQVKQEQREFNIKCLSIIFIDIDNLKKANDLYGHKFGDKLLKKNAEVFKKNLREIDILGRWGGDEFVIGLVNIDERGAYNIAKKIKNNLAKIKIEEHPKIKCGASFGIIAITVKDKKIINLSLHDIIEKADLAMYRAKKQNNNGHIVIYNEELEFESENANLVEN